MEAEQKIIDAFNSLETSSRTAFQFTRCVDESECKQWDVYYNKCFDIFSKLWSFQSAHRKILEKKLKFSRKDIGDIANKIGQLYYHYYLRTSEKSHLKEAFTFLDAILQRKYYSSSDYRPDLKLKYLRCCARLLMICLLLNNRKIILIVMNELESVINEFNVDSNEKIENNSTTSQHIQQWKKLLLDIKKFTQSLGYCESIHVHCNVLMTFSSLDLARQARPIKSFHLSKAVIINLDVYQPQFDCFTLDTFRIFNTFDRAKYVDNENHCCLNGPQKKILNSPSSVEALSVIYQMLRDLDTSVTHKQTSKFECNNHGLFIYLTSNVDEDQFVEAQANSDTFCHTIRDNHPVRMSHVRHFNQHQALLRPKSNDQFSLDGKPVEFNDENNFVSPASSPPPQKRLKLSTSNQLISDDLLPATRRPLFLIVDGSRSKYFLNMTSKFQEPLLCLLSSKKYPKSLSEVVPWNGNLMTCFLHRPMLGLYLICQGKMEKFSLLDGELIDQLMENEIKWTSHVIEKILVSHPELKPFIEIDQITRNFLSRFIFFYIAIKLHREFTHSDMFPSIVPDMSQTLDEILLKDDYLLSILKKNVEILGLCDYFCFINDMRYVPDN